jgi:hypothetical protein
MLYITIITTYNLKPMNEYEVIVFENYQINILEDESLHYSDEETPDIEYTTTAEENDIFTSEHLWDNIPNLRYRFKPEFWNYSDFEKSFFE